MNMAKAIRNAAYFAAFFAGLLTVIFFISWLKGMIPGQPVTYPLVTAIVFLMLGRSFR